jgi:ubiquinol-cytochrome c reductase cytochrome b subunit
MFRARLYGSYKEPRELIWIFGVLIYLALMAEAFLGYLLPWGQMSYWGAQVIVNLFGVIPFIGPDLALWIRGDYVVSDVTLNRFFALHVIAIPLVLLGLVVAHILALHDVGSNNPDGVEIKKTKDAQGRPVDGIPFHPYYTVKDTVGAVVFLAIFCIVMFFMPEMGGYFIEDNNFIPADPLKTPEHIAPLWYFTPYYSILRAVPPLFNSQFPGVLAMGIAVLILFLLPWLDRSPVKSIRYRGAYYKIALALFVVAFVILGYLGIESTTVWGQFAATEGSLMDRMLDTKDRATWVARVCTVLYFAFFILMPWYTARDKVKPVPDRVTM